MGFFSGGKMHIGNMEVKMSKRLNITDKLDFDTKRTLVIRDVEIAVNADAATMLKLMDASEGMDTKSYSFVKKMLSLLFDEEELKKLEALKLSFADLMVVITAASDLVASESEEDEGNVPSPTTTSEETLA